MHLLGRLDGVPALAVGLPEDAPTPEGWHASGLRGYWDRLADEHFALAGRAFQLLEWDRTQPLLRRAAATPTERMPGERAMRCPSCGTTAYPRLTPAVIVRVDRGDELLLAQGVRFPRPFYSVLAGFVEPGESLEDTIHREIREEVGVEVDDLRYFGSQPWPFPNSLMIGFTADVRRRRAAPRAHRAARRRLVPLGRAARTCRAASASPAGSSTRSSTSGAPRRTQST